MHIPSPVEEAGGMQFLGSLYVVAICLSSVCGWCKVLIDCHGVLVDKVCFPFFLGFNNVQNTLVQEDVLVLRGKRGGKTMKYIPEYS